MMLTNKYFQGIATAIALSLSLASGANAASFSFSTGAIADPLASPPPFTKTDFTTSVTGLSATTQVKLSFNLSHNDLSDLEIYLTDPSGKVLNIATSLIGAPGSINATFSDGLFPNTDLSSSPYNGNFTPSGSGSSPIAFALTPTITNFAGFNGLIPNGTWKLTVADLAPQNSGRLNSATLDIETRPVPFEFSPVIGLLSLGAFGLYQQCHRRK